MHKIRARSSAYFILFVSLVSSGCAVAELSQDDWKPIISQTNRIDYRRSFDSQGTTASTPLQSSGSSFDAFSRTGYRRSLDEQVGTGRTLQSPSWSQSSAIASPDSSGSTYRSYHIQDNGQSSWSQSMSDSTGPTSRTSYRPMNIRDTERSSSSFAPATARTSDKPTSRSSYSRSSGTQNTARFSSSVSPSTGSSSVNSASPSRRSYDTQSDTGRGFSSSWLQNSLNVLKAISKKSTNVQESRRTSASSKWSPSSRIDESITTKRTSIPEYNIEQKQVENTVSSSSWFPSFESPEYRVLKRVFDDCLSSGDSVNCLKSKTVTFLDRVAKVKRIPLFDGVSLARAPNANVQPRVSNDGDNTGRDSGDESDRLDQMIYDRLIDFWNSHMIQVDFSARSKGEGRGKEKKLAGYLITAMAAAAATVGPLAFKGLAAFAFMALVAAKMAFVLASLLALKALSHGGGGGGHRSFTEDREDSFFPYFSKPEARSLDDADEETHRMAYGRQLKRPIMVV